MGRPCSECKTGSQSPLELERCTCAFAAPLPKEQQVKEARATTWAFPTAKAGAGRSPCHGRLEGTPAGLQTVPAGSEAAPPESFLANRCYRQVWKDVVASPGGVPLELNILKIMAASWRTECWERWVDDLNPWPFAEIGPTQSCTIRVVKQNLRPLGSSVEKS